MPRCCSGGCASAGVQGDEFLFLGDPGDCEAGTADAGALGLDDIQDGCGCYRGVEGVAALSQDLKAGLRGERLAGGDYAVACEDFRASLGEPAAGAVAADGSESFGGAAGD